jgi:ribosomal subunit interface protein
MQVTISAHNLIVSDRFRDYVAERAPKIEHFVHKAADLQVKVTRHDHSRQAGPEDELELVTHAGSDVVRAHASAGDKFAAFDVAFDKLLEQLRRLSDKRKVHRGRHGSPGASELSASDFRALDVHPVDAELLLSVQPEKKPKGKH